MPVRSQPTPVCFRAKPQLVAAITEAAQVRGWSRTTWILHALGQALERDRRLFGLTPEEQARDVERRAAEVERNRRDREKAKAAR